MTIFAGGSLASGITAAGRHLSLALCATAVVAHNTMAATDSRDVPIELVYFRFAMFFLPFLIDPELCGFIVCESDESHIPRSKSF